MADYIVKHLYSGSKGGGLQLPNKPADTPTPPAKTPAPVLNPAAVVGQVNSNQAVQIVGFNATYTYTIQVSAGSYTLDTSTGVITWTLPNTTSPSGVTMSVTAKAPGQDTSNITNCPATVSAQPVTATPTVGTPSSLNTTVGSSYTVTTNFTSYAAGRTMRTVPTSGVLLNTSTGVLTITPSAVGTSNVTVFITEPGKAESTGITTQDVNVAAAAVAIDPIVDGTIIAASDVQAVYHMHRMVAGYTGNTVRVRRSSDSVQADFGVDATGRLNIGAIMSWRGSSAVTFEGWIDQLGTGKFYPATTAGSVPFCDAAGVVERHFYTHSTANDDTAGQLTLSTTEGCPGVRVTTGATFTLDNSGLTTANGIEFYLSASYTARCAASNSTQPTALGNDGNVQRFVMSYGASGVGSPVATHELQLRMGVNGTGSLEMSVHRTGSTSQSNIACPPNIYTKKNSFRVRAMGLNATTFFGRNLGKPTTTTANASNQAAVSGLANGRLRIGSNFAGTGSPAPMLVSGIIVTKTLTDYQRYILESRMALAAFDNLAMTVTDMVNLYGDWIDWRDVSGDPTTANRTVVGKRGNVTLNVRQSADWVRNYTVPTVGVTGLRRINNNGTAVFDATTNYLTNATEATLLHFHFYEGTSTAADLYDYISLAASSTDYDRPALSVGRDHQAPRLMTTTDPAIDTNDRSTVQYASPGDNVLGNWSQPMGKYSLKLCPGLIVSPTTTTVVATIAALYGGGTIPSGTTIDNAYMQTRFNVIAATPELRRWGDTAVVGNAALPYAGNNGTGSGPGMLELVIGTSKKNPSFNFTSAQEALVRTATNTLHCANGQGSVFGSLDSDVAIAPGTGPHMKAPSTFKICSTSYQSAGGGPLPPSTLLVSAFADVPITMRQAQATQLNMYKIYTQGYT